MTETDCVGPLTVDHFQPRAHGGSDALDNLVYSCPQCNTYKAAYWPEDMVAPRLWNPRTGPAASDLLELADGLLLPLSPEGAFTILRLRLNRPALVVHRLRQREQQSHTALLRQYAELLNIEERLRAQQAKLLEEQKALLTEQRRLLRLLLGEAE